MREPKNQYDRNAIRVDNFSNEQVGHVGRAWAAALAPLMDEKRRECRMRLEATVSHESGSKFRKPARIEFYGPSGQVNRLESHLKRYKLALSESSRVMPSSLMQGLAADVRDRINKMAGQLKQEFTGSNSHYSQLANPSLHGYDQKKGFHYHPHASSSAYPHASYVDRKTTVVKQWTENDLDEIFDKLKGEKKKSFKKLSKAQVDVVKSPLYDHQKDAISWMLERENNPDGGKLPKFFEERTERGRTVYYNTITNSSQKVRPPNVHGGLLADDMGLGKTLSTLSVIAIQLEKEKQTYLANKSPTMIICPLSVLTNWELQVEEHLYTDTLKILIYHGPHRHESINFCSEQLNQFDLVLTTYATIASEFETEQEVKERLEEESGIVPSTSQNRRKKKKKKRKRAVATFLFDVVWRRIILDEAHNIRNRNTRQFKACNALDADARWCLTGTPFINKPADIQALFEFLRAAPLDNVSVWGRSVGRPLRYGDGLALHKIRALLGAISMRRTKDLLKDRLPTKTVEQHVVKMGKQERVVYDLLFESARIVFNAVLEIDEGEILQNYSHILECLLRLRQTCCSWKMVPSVRVENAQKVMDIFARMESRGEKITLEKAKELFEKLQGILGTGGNGESGSGAGDDGGGDNEVVECCVCLQEQTGAHLRILKNCQHCVCDLCLEKIIQYAPGSGTNGGSGKCPLCREPFVKADIHSLEELKTVAEQDTEKAEAEPEEEEDTLAAKKNFVERLLQERASGEEYGGCPTKVLSLVGSIRSEIKSDPTAKFVVFSQFTTYLQEIHHHLQNLVPELNLLQFVGSMNSQRRKETLSTFANSKGPLALLVSLRAGGTGLNLTAANHAFLMDLWWNPAVEEQAMDRIHRIGQKKPVKIVRYMSENSVEERIQKMQDGKKLFGKGTLGKVSAAELRKVRIGVLCNLFSKQAEEEPEVVEAVQAAE